MQRHWHELQLCLDVESIVQTFSPLAKLVGELQGVRAHAVELSTLSPNQDPRSQLMNSNWNCFRCRRICAGSRIMFNR